MRLLLVILLAAGIVVLPATTRYANQVPFFWGATAQLNEDTQALDSAFPDEDDHDNISPLLNLFEDDLAVENDLFHPIAFESFRYDGTVSDPPPAAHLEQPERPPAPVAA